MGVLGNAENYDKEKSLVTFVMFSYNQERYIEDACRAALAQTYSPLEIIFSDDCSVDRTFELLEAIVKSYKGPHKTILNRNQKNLGLINHVNKLFEISSGDLMVIAAGDDISLSDRVECLVHAFNQGGKKALVIHSSAMKINELNIELGILIPPVIGQSMSTVELADCQSLYIGATAAWSRSLYKEFGPIVFQDAYEDLVLGFRAVIKHSLAYVDKPLVRYRVGVGISTKSKFSILKISSRIATRKKILKIALDVYEQRLRDLDCIEQSDSEGALKSRLIRNINVQHKKLLFYRNPFSLLICFFSKDCIVALRSFSSEVKYLIGINN